MPMLDDDIRDLARAHGITESALHDVIMQFPNDNRQTFAEWFESVHKPHWQEPKAVIAGDECYSIKAQSAFAKQHGEVATVAHLAKFDLKLGHVLKSPASSADSADIDKGANNPWHPSYRDPQGAEAERLRIIKANTNLARGMAAAAGVRIDGGPLLGRK